MKSQIDFAVFVWQIAALSEVGLMLFSSFAYDQEGFVFDRVGEEDAAQLKAAYPAGDLLFTQCVEDFAKLFDSVIGLGYWAQYLTVD